MRAPLATARGSTANKEPIMINCGNCHNYHETVADVRACHLVPALTVAPGRSEPTATTPALAIALPVTERQWNYMVSLAMERGVTLKPEREWSKRDASAEIQRLLTMPKTTTTPATPPADMPQVPAGRYALRDAETNEVKFYIVDKPTEGRWAGRTFVSVQASDDKHPVKSPTIRNSILRRIAKDPKAAMLLYGTELKHCGNCGRTLTNAESRARGIGPDCAALLGW
jgi:hypothetical protein